MMISTMIRSATTTTLATPGKTATWATEGIQREGASAETASATTAGVMMHAGTNNSNRGNTCHAYSTAINTSLDNLC
jgi:hypothetical protein